MGHNVVFSGCIQCIIIHCIMIIAAAIFISSNDDCVFMLGAFKILSVSNSGYLQSCCLLQTPIAHELNHSRFSFKALIHRALTCIYKQWTNQKANYFVIIATFESHFPLLIFPVHRVSDIHQYLLTSFLIYTSIYLTHFCRAHWLKCNIGKLKLIFT